MVNQRYEKYKEQYKEYLRKNKGKFTKYRKDYNRKYKDLLEFNGNKQIALERDGFICKKCGLNQEQHIVLFGRGLHVHHIDEFGRNSLIKNNELNNLITLCVRCHAMLHSIDSSFSKQEIDKNKYDEFLRIKKEYPEKSLRQIAKQMCFAGNKITHVTLSKWNRRENKFFNREQ
jgi:hypothetical protein